MASKIIPITKLFMSFYVDESNNVRAHKVLHNLSTNNTPTVG